MDILENLFDLFGGLEETIAQVTRIVPFENFDETPFYEVFFYGDDRQVYRWIPNPANVKLDIQPGDYVKLRYNPKFCHPIDPDAYDMKNKYSRDLVDHKQLKIEKTTSPF